MAGVLRDCHMLHIACEYERSCADDGRRASLDGNAEGKCLVCILLGVLSWSNPCILFDDEGHIFTKVDIWPCRLSPIYYDHHGTAVCQTKLPNGTRDTHVDRMCRVRHISSMLSILHRVDSTCSENLHDCYYAKWDIHGRNRWILTVRNFD